MRSQHPYAPPHPHRVYLAWLRQQHLLRAQQYMAATLPYEVARMKRAEQARKAHVERWGAQIAEVRKDVARSRYGRWDAQAIGRLRGEQDRLALSMATELKRMAPGPVVRIAGRAKVGVSNPLAEIDDLDARVAALEEMHRLLGREQ